MALNTWDRIFKADNVIQSLRPLTYISYISLAPFGFSLNGKNKIYIPKYTIVIGIVYFLFYLCYKFGNTRVSIYNNIVIIAIFGFAIIMRRKLVSIVQSIYNMNEIFGRLGIKIKYKPILRFTFLSSIAMLILFALSVAVQVRYLLYSMSDLLEITIEAVFHFNVILLVFKYVCLTHLARSLFSLINEALHHILEATTTMDISPINSGAKDTSIISQNPENAAKEISKIHDMLCEICETIEDYFAYPLVTILAISSYNIIISTYLVVVELINPNPHSYAYEMSLMLPLTETIYFSVIIFVIVEASNRTVGQSSSSATIVHKILNITDDLKLKDRLNTFSQQLIHRKVSFTAAGLISLDRTLILTVASAAVCYIIILAQFYPEHFKKPTEEQTNDNNKSDCMHCLQLLDKISCINVTGWT